MMETKYKGVGELKRDGGWLTFLNFREAKQHFLAKYDRYQLIEHCVSTKKEEVDFEKIKTNKRELNEPEIAPFNSATEHYRKIMGLQTNRVNLNQLPKWLRVFYYFIVGFVVIGSLFLLYALIFK